MIFIRSVVSRNQQFDLYLGLGYKRRRNDGDRHPPQSLAPTHYLSDYIAVKIGLNRKMPSRFPPVVFYTPKVGEDLTDVVG